ncbi:MAG: serine/threonine-protein kinase [Deltaproteobacteria bacterium]|nr:serine/threonine-protein kinase [Deltaproteobacteria bacterium]
MSTEDPEDRTEVVTRPVDPRAAGQPFRLGRYRLEKLIGQGGMAEVYLARAESGDGSRVVVKRIRPSLLQDAASKKHVEMFLREAKLLASLDHQNIVRILELGIEPPRNGKAIGEHFLAMEHLEGLTLRDLAWRQWAAQKPLPIEVIVRVVADLCVGLDHAHQMKDPATGKGAALVHRDISPDNVLVTTSGVTKLLDFGVAKRQGWAGLTSAGELKGKIPFMAPEQLKEEPVDGRTDVFAVGVVLYWLLTGRRPFDGPSEIFVMKAILDDAPPRLRLLNPGVPPDLEDLVLSCLEKDRDTRMPSAAALHDALLAILPRHAHVSVVDVLAAATQLPAVERETQPALASAVTVPWEPLSSRVDLPPEFIDLPPTQNGEDLEVTMPGVAAPPPPDERRRIGTSGRVLLVGGDLAGTETTEVARLQAEIARLEAKLMASSSSSAAGLISAVGPLLWGLEQAIAHIASLAPAEATLGNHLRQLQILHAVLKRLVESTDKR